jgi:hypothetical protein
MPVTIVYAKEGTWPVTFKTAAEVNITPVMAQAVAAITVSGEELDIVVHEFKGLPIYQYTDDWFDVGMTWFWADASFIAAHIAHAARLHDAGTATKGVKR